MTKKTGKPKGRPREWTDQKIKDLGESLIDFCKREDVFHLVQWTREQSRTTTWFYDLVSKHPVLSDYHEQAKEILGGKILQLAFKTGNNWAIQTFIPRYLKDIDDYLENKEDNELDRRKDFEKYKASLNKTREDEAIAKIEEFNSSQAISFEYLKMKKFLKEKGLLEELKNSQHLQEGSNRPSP